MKYFLAITFLAILTNYSAAGLNCWLCVGSLDSDCFRGEERAMAVQNCAAAVRNATTPQSPLGLKDYDVAGDDNRAPDVIVTTCVSFVIEEYGSLMIQRGCGYIYEGIDICAYMSEIAEISMCDSCNEDKCNSKAFG